ncbi:MAG: hypothetical protein RMY34_14160 [Aulosira sp. DedQUE10]|nr:hypothetical protein [Aulosira sp. DedQUE10]
MSIYIISPEAIQDLDEISEYFASRNLDAAIALSIPLKKSVKI